MGVRLGALNLDFVQETFLFLKLLALMYVKCFALTQIMADCKFNVVMM